MQINDVQLGTPMIPFSGSKSAIEALSVSEGAIAFATDTHLIGFYDGTAWVWLGEDTVQAIAPAYAEIHLAGHTADVAQIVPTGSTFTKLTGFDEEGLFKNCTLDVPNDQIILDRAGAYLVEVTLNLMISTQNVLYEFAAFVDDAMQHQVYGKVRLENSSEEMNIKFSGLVNAAAGATLNVRAKHDYNNSVSTTLEYANLTAVWLSEDLIYLLDTMGADEDAGVTMDERVPDIGPTGAAWDTVTWNTQYGYAINSDPNTDTRAIINAGVSNEFSLEYNLNNAANQANVAALMFRVVDIYNSWVAAVNFGLGTFYLSLYEDATPTVVASGSIGSVIDWTLLRLKIVCTGDFIRFSLDYGDGTWVELADPEVAAVNDPYRSETIVGILANDGDMQIDNFRCSSL